MIFGGQTGKWISWFGKWIMAFLGGYVLADILT